MFGRALGDDAELRPLEPWQAAEFAAHADRARDSLKPWIPFAYTVVDEASARVTFLFNGEHRDVQVWAIVV